MLANAKLYEEQVKKLFTNIVFDMDYKYSCLAVYREEYKIPESTWDGHHFVSLQENQVIGYISYWIDRPSDVVTGIHIVHFEKSYPYVFGRDVITAIRDIFEKFNMRKINFSVVIGNPIEKCYDRLIKMAGGRIVGIREKEVHLIDGQIYDLKLYEILAENYHKLRKSKITCDDCKYGIDVNESGRVKLCDNPNLKTFGENVKHGHRFSCGYGVMWNDKVEN